MRSQHEALTNRATAEAGGRAIDAGDVLKNAFRLIARSWAKKLAGSPEIRSCLYPTRKIVSILVYFRKTLRFLYRDLSNYIENANYFPGWVYKQFKL